MRQTEILPQPRCHPRHGGFCRLLRAPAGSRPFPALLRASFSTCLDPYPACSGGALAYSFPPDNGLPDKPIRSALRQLLYSSFRRGEVLEAAVIRFSSGPPICSPPRLLLPQRSGARQPWLLRPRRTRFVTSLSRGYASRPCIELAHKSQNPVRING